MTADERIENLLNSFGQTIADLPKAEASRRAYSWEHLDSANLAVCHWYGKQGPGTSFDWEDYICHLCDVIDRMEAALLTARRMMSCFVCNYNGPIGKTCKKFKDHCRENACFVLDDEFLTGEDD